MFCDQQPTRRESHAEKLGRVVRRKDLHPDHFPLHAPQAHQAKHVKICDQTVDGIGKCGRLIFLKNKVAEPSESVTTNWHQRKGYGLNHSHKKQNQNGQSSNKMQTPVHSLPMLTDVKGPESFVICILFHWFGLSIQNRSGHRQAPPSFA